MGSYTTAGKTVQFSDGDTLRDVADLWAIVDGEYKGTPSIEGDALEQMLGDLRGGKPLSDVEWTLLAKIRRKYAAQLDEFRNSPDGDLEGFVPLPAGGAGRLAAALRWLPPTYGSRLRERGGE